MKKLLLLFSLISIAALADTNEVDLVGGSLTYHIIDPTNYSPYGPTFTSNGRGVINMVEAGRYIDYKDNGNYWSIVGMYGQNSIFQPIYGGMYSRGIHFKYVDLGVLVGGYIQDDTQFTARGLGQGSIGYGTHALVAGVGAEANFIIPLTDNVVLRQNNILMPLIINSTIGIGVKF